MALLWCTPVDGQPQRGVQGKVVDEVGNGIAQALVIASGVGFTGWGETKEDGSFELERAGAFVSVRHKDFKPRVVPTSALSQPLTLAQADGTNWNVPVCDSMPEEGREWMGGGLRIREPMEGLRGPVSGEHDTHWYVDFERASLHVVDGYIWHAGVPMESVLTASREISARSWIYEDIVGLDLGGEANDGTYWRWVGAPVSSALEYNGASKAAAEYFDSIIATMCWYVYPARR
jgi:hypothetical protein